MQLLLCREYNESPHRVPAMLHLSPSNHALGDLNVQRKAIFGADAGPLRPRILLVRFGWSRLNGCARNAQRRL